MSSEMDDRPATGPEELPADCETAVSTSAYLADLLEYVLRHVRTDGDKLGIDAFEEMFYRPFGDLSIDGSDGSRREVQYVRLGVESLLRFLLARRRENGEDLSDLLAAPKSAGLANRTYRVEAYETLLDEWGTSREELRRARYETATRESVADRLGIDPGRVFSTGGDGTDDIHLDADAKAGDANAASEANLEAVFGLPATIARANGPKLADRSPVAPEDAAIHDWRLASLREQWREADHPEDPYLSFVSIAGSRASSVSGDHVTPVSSASGNTYLLGRSFADARPAIDPDVIGPDDLREPEIGNPAFDIWVKRRRWVDQNREAIDATLASNWTGTGPLDAALTQLDAAVVYGQSTPMPSSPDSADRHGNPVDEWRGLGWTPAGTPDTARLRTLAGVLAGKRSDGATGPDHEQAREEVRALGLTPEGVARLAELLGKRDRAARGDGEAVSDDELWEAAGILVRARKQQLREPWVREEFDRDVQLDGSRFWGSLRQPEEGEWSSRLDAHARSEPFVDPERVAREALPGPTAGRDAHALYEKRLRALKDKRAAFEQRIRDEQRRLQNRSTTLESAFDSKRQSLASGGTGDESPVDAVLDDVYGTPSTPDPNTPDTWATELEWIARGLQTVDDPNDPTDAHSRAIDRLESRELSPEQFQTLRSLRDRAKPSNVGDLSDEAFADLLTLLPVGSPLYPVLDAVYGQRSDTWRAYLRSAREQVRDPERPDTERKALDLSEESFERLLALRERTMPWNGGADDEELSEFVRTLTSVWKHRERYDDWVDAEKSGDWVTAPGVDVGGSSPTPAEHAITDYWQARKARLPPWLATRDDRMEWLNALATRSERPLLDPDLLPESVFDGGPAKTLWADRRTALGIDGSSPAAEIGRIDAEIGRLRSGSGDLGALLASVIGIDGDRLLGIAQQAADGKDVSLRLAQFDLTPAALSYLVEVIRANRENRPLTDDEWESLRHLLVDVWKRRQFGRWRREERALDVVVRPEEFELPEEDEQTTTPTDSQGPARWRTDADAYRDWLDVLETRTEQRDAVAEQVANAVTAAEEAHLTTWRDELLERLDEPSTNATFAETAEWASERLLLDLETDGCRETTRVDAAIESLQTLVFSLDTGQNDALDGLKLDIEDEHFDARWKWLGSYRKWKSAMGVYLYPENVLFPTLRNEQTPMFRFVSRRVRQGDPFDPVRGNRGPMVEYARYLDDLSELRPEAACQVSSASGGDGYLGPQSPQGYRAGTHGKRLGYVFARAGSSDRYYYRAFDPAVDRPDTVTDAAGSHAYWQRLRKFDDIDGEVRELGGAVTYRDRIYLFVIVATDNSTEVGYLTYRNGLWEDYQSLSLPDNSDTVTSVHVPHVEGAHHRPDLFVRDSSNELFYSRFEADGSASGSFTGPLQPVGSEFGDWSDLAGAVRYRDVVYLFKNGGGDGPAAAEYYTWIPNQNAFAEDSLSADEVDHYQPGPPEALPRSGGGGTRLQVTTVFAKHQTPRDGPYDDYGAMWEELTARLRNVSQVFREGDAVYAYGTSSTERELTGDTDGESPPSADIGGSGKRLIWKINLNGSTNPSGHGLETTQIPVKTLRGEGRTAVRPLFIDPSPELYGQIVCNNTDPYLPPAGQGSASEASWRTAGHSTVLIQRADPDVGAGAYRNPEAYTGIGMQSVRFVEESNTNNYDLYPTIGLKPVIGIGYTWPYGPTDVSDADLDTAVTAHARTTRRLYRFNNEPLKRSTLLYFEEAHFHLPLLIARQLTERGDFETALDWFRTVYDYTGEVGSRKIWYGLTRGGTAADELTPGQQWLRSPIDPHGIAEGRSNTGTKYTQFTVFSVVQCLLDYADAEFSRDTAGSVARARTMYETALDLLESPDIRPLADADDELIVKLREAQQQQSQTTFAKLQADGQARIESHRQLLTDPEVVKALRDTTLLAEQEMLATGQQSGYQGGGGTDGQGGGNGGGSGGQDGEGTDGDGVNVASGAPSAGYRRGGGDRQQGSRREATGWRSVPLAFCIHPNPYPETLRRKARMELRKIRSCRNISGMEREQDPYNTSTDVESAVPTPEGGPGGITADSRTTVQPTNYRYDTLIARAEKLSKLAGQIESEFLRSIEKAESEEYRLRKARQDLELAEAKVRLEKLRVAKARDRIELSRLERERARIRADHYSRLISQGLLKQEQNALGRMDASIDHLHNAIGAYEWAFRLHVASAAFSAAAAAPALIAGITGGSAMGGAVGGATGGAAVVAAIPKVGSKLASASSSAAAAASSKGQIQSTKASIDSKRAQILKTRASYRRRHQRWQLQKQLANQGIRVGDQKVELAEDSLDIARQQREISELRVEHAQDRAHYLADEQFTDEDLYRWMSRTLERVYRYFLQQAASVARLAENQLAFERQTLPGQFVQSNYWEAPRDGRTIVREERSDAVDRRGLTGSARLLQDIYELDQYEFRTDQRKLEVEKTISIADLDPVALQLFRETGILQFSTPMDLFERDYPGQYLRLIEDVEVSVIALVPPNDGVKATLRNSGTSGVVVGDRIFEKRTIRRQPESVVLAPSGTNRRQELRLQPDSEEMLRPFENLGVETSWQLEMPKPANDFDFSTIADVQLTIRYTALESETYRRQVIDRLDPERSVARSFLFEEDFASQWYDLNNPSTTSDPMRVTFETGPDDFPAGLSDLEIEGVQLYFVGPDGEQVRDREVTLTHAPPGSSRRVGGAATPTDGIVGTPAASAWTDIVDTHPAGTWTLDLTEYRELFERDAVDDVLFVTTVAGTEEGWPR